MFTIKRRRKVSDTADNRLSDMLMVLCLSQKFFSQRRIITILPILLFCTLGVTGTQGRNEVDYTNIYCLETLICFCFVYTAQCFGGVETYEKTAGVAFTSVSNLQGLVSQPGTAVTRDCAALCKQTATCAAFTVGLCTINFVVIVCEITTKNSHHQ